MALEADQTERERPTGSARCVVRQAAQEPGAEEHEEGAPQAQPGDCR